MRSGSYFSRVASRGAGGRQLLRPPRLLFRPMARLPANLEIETQPLPEESSLVLPSSSAPLVETSLAKGAIGKAPPEPAIQFGAFPQPNPARIRQEPDRSPDVLQSRSLSLESALPTDELQADAILGASGPSPGLASAPKRPPPTAVPLRRAEAIDSRGSGPVFSALSAVAGVDGPESASTQSGGSLRPKTPLLGCSHDSASQLMAAEPRPAAEKALRRGDIGDGKAGGPRSTGFTRMALADPDLAPGSTTPGWPARFGAGPTGLHNRAPSAMEPRAEVRIGCLEVRIVPAQTPEKMTLAAPTAGPAPSLPVPATLSRGYRSYGLVQS